MPMVTQYYVSNNNTSYGSSCGNNQHHTRRSWFLTEVTGNCRVANTKNSGEHLSSPLERKIERLLQLVPPSAWQNESSLVYDNSSVVACGHSQTCVSAIQSLSYLESDTWSPAKQGDSGQARSHQPLFFKTLRASYRLPHFAYMSTQAAALTYISLPIPERG